MARPRALTGSPEAACSPPDVPNGCLQWLAARQHTTEQPPSFPSAASRTSGITGPAATTRCVRVTSGGPGEGLASHVLPKAHGGFFTSSHAASGHQDLLRGGGRLITEPVPKTSSEAPSASTTHTSLPQPNATWNPHPKGPPSASSLRCFRFGLTAQDLGARGGREPPPSLASPHVLPRTRRPHH